MPDSRRQDADVLKYFKSKATKKMVCDRLTWNEFKTNLHSILVNSPNKNSLLSIGAR
jgi:hypothetical protein